MQKEKDNTDQQISKFIEFRQALYQDGFTRRKDAQSELLDAFMLKDQNYLFSYAELLDGVHETLKC